MSSFFKLAVDDFHTGRVVPLGPEARAGLEDGRIHDLRYAYASRALALGESLTMIGKLLGHT